MRAKMTARGGRRLRFQSGRQLLCLANNIRACNEAPWASFRYKRSSLAQVADGISGRGLDLFQAAFDDSARIRHRRDARESDQLPHGFFRGRWL